MKKVNLLMVALLFCAVGYGCTTPSMNVDSPTGVTQKKVNSIKVGVTTQAEITELFGEPENKIPTDDGESWFLKDINLNSIWVLFDHKGVVQDMEYSE